MKKINNKGFALVETLIVSVFVVSLFLIVFSNFYPLMAEYEKRENYDDIDSVYAAYWIKKLVEDKTDVTNSKTPFKKVDVLNKILTSDDLCHYFDVNGVAENYQEWQQKCYAIFNLYGIKYVYITDYNISTFKDNFFTALNDYSSLSLKASQAGMLPEYRRSDINDDSSQIKANAGRKISGKYTAEIFPDFEGYLKYLPNYSNKKNNTYGSNIRVIVFRRLKYNVEGTGGFWYSSFANMEGNKSWKA